MGDCQGVSLVISRFQIRFPAVAVSVAVVSLGKKLHSPCLSHPPVKPGQYFLRAQLKSSFCIS